MVISKKLLNDCNKRNRGINLISEDESIKYKNREIHIYPFSLDDNDNYCTVEIVSKVTTDKLPEGLQLNVLNGEIDNVLQTRHFVYYLKISDEIKEMPENCNDGEITVEVARDQIFNAPLLLSSGFTTAHLKLKGLPDYIHFGYAGLVVDEEYEVFSSIDEIFDVYCDDMINEYSDYKIKFQSFVALKPELVSSTMENELKFIGTIDHRFFTEGQRKNLIDKNRIKQTTIRRLLEKSDGNVYIHEALEYEYLGELSIENGDPKYRRSPYIVSNYINDAMDKLFLLALKYDVFNLEFVYNSITEKWNYPKDVNRYFEYNSVSNFTSLYLLGTEIVSYINELIKKLNLITNGEVSLNMYVIFKITTDYTIIILKDLTYNKVYGHKTPRYDSLISTFLNYMMYEKDNKINGKIE